MSRRDYTPSIEEQDAEWDDYAYPLLMDCLPARIWFQKAIARIQRESAKRSAMGRRQKSEREAWANLVKLSLRRSVPRDEDVGLY